MHFEQYICSPAKTRVHICAHRGHKCLYTDGGGIYIYAPREENMKEKQASTTTGEKWKGKREKKNDLVKELRICTGQDAKENGGKGGGDV